MTPEALAIRNHTIAQDSLKPGMNYQKLAKKHGLSKAGIQYVMSKPEIRAIVKQGEQQLVAMVPLAVDVVYNTLKDPKNSNNFKAAVKVLDAMGITPSHTTSNIYNTVINTNIQQNQLEITVRNALFGHTRQLSDDNQVIDGELIDDDT